MDERRFKKRHLFLLLYIVFALLPIYWMVNMSFRTNQEILSSFSLFPMNPTWDNYATIFTDVSWYSGYINSLIYVAINTVISVTVALPAAYAFSRYSFLGDKHVFFWLLTNRMTPPAVFLLPFFQLYSTVGLMDTHIAVAMAHLLFNVPLAVWILEGFMSGIPREIDETAYIDGYSFPAFFVKVFLPLIKAGVGVTAFFLFHVQLGGTALGQNLDQRQRQADCGHHDPHRQRLGHGLGDLGCCRGAHHRARCHRDLVCAALHRQGLCHGARMTHSRRQPHA
jgi:glycerol transport system permease protein